MNTYEIIDDDGVIESSNDYDEILDMFLILTDIGVANHIELKGDVKLVQVLEVKNKMIQSNIKKFLPKWEKIDQQNYQFNLNLKASIGLKAILKGRHFNKGERKFIEELEQKNDLIREKYTPRSEWYN